MKENDYILSPIGYVKAGENGFYLEIKKDYLPALKELENFSHVNVFWWCHLADDKNGRNVLECEQPYQTSPAKVGTFATRSPLRPNPVALTAVSISRIDVDKGVIQIPYIDAEPGTPIIDLKPYHPATDRIKDVSVPDWCNHWPKWVEDSATFDWEAEFVTAH